MAGKALLVAVLAALSAFAGAYGFASTLGFGTSGLGAGSTLVASCGSGMRFAYTTSFSPAASEYVVDRIELSDIPAGCRSKSFSASFYDHTGASIGSPVDATLTGSGATQGIAVAASSDGIDASRIGGVSVVVS
jgi:hypothetical protein